MGQLAGRVAIVTGASSGIGRATALKFAAEGAAVVACARREDKLADLVREVQSAGGRAMAIACDVAHTSQIAQVATAAVDAFGGIDILANIAQGGMEELGQLSQTDPRDVEYAFATGPIQSMLFMQQCFPHMKAQGRGRIINTASPAALTGFPGLSAYAMAKAAILALSRNASQEWGQFGIVTNTFLPWVRTETFDRTEIAKNLPQMEASSPLRRMGTPYEDCTPILAFLASDDAGYINGQVIAVDGGRRLIA